MLRKGPEDVPASWLVLFFAVGLLALSFFSSAVLIDDSANDSLSLSFLVTVSSYVLYWFVLLVNGFSHRLLPTVSAIMACGSIISIVAVASRVFLQPFLSTNLTLVTAQLIVLWTIPVKGHIIARAIDRHWYIGIVIAMAVFIMQNVAYVAMIAPAAD